MSIKVIPNAFGIYFHALMKILHPICKIGLQLAILALAASSPLHGEIRKEKRPAVAVVLSGGGSRGLAQIGVLKAFDEAGIKPDLIVASSMGAIVGGLYAAGFSGLEIDSIVHTVNLDDLFANEAKRRTLRVSEKTEPTDFLFEMRFEDDLTPIWPKSISMGQTLYEILSPLLAEAVFRSGNSFDNLPIPLRVIATDLVSAQMIVFSEGSLAEAIRASCGIPVAFAPVSRDSMLLVDGGLTANIPVEPALDAGAQYIIAVDVTSPMWEKGDIDNPIRLFDQLVAIGINRKKALERELADIVIRPKLKGFRNTDFALSDTLIQLGYEEAKNRMDEILTGIAAIEPEAPADSLIAAPPFLVENKAIPGIDSLCRSLSEQHNTGGMSTVSLKETIEDFSRQKGFEFACATVTGGEKTRIHFDPGVIKSIAISGNTRTSAKLILGASGLTPGTVISRNLIAKTIPTLYATNLFDNVGVEVDSNSVVHIKVSEKPYLRTRSGLRFDEFHLGEFYVQPAYENLFGLGLAIQIHIQYGLRREKYVAELKGSQLFSSSWANNIRILGYVSRETIVKEIRLEKYPDPLDSSNVETIVDEPRMTLRKAGVSAIVGTQIGRVAMLSGGFRLERFKVTRSSLGAWNDGLRNFRDGMRYVMVQLAIDDLDRYPFPRQGHMHHITLGGASDAIGGTESFVNVHGSLKYFTSVGDKHTISPQVFLAWANKELPDVERTYLGGSPLEEKYRDIGVYNYISFMGLKPRSLVGDDALQLRLSYRFAIAKNFFYNASLDWGCAWDTGENNAPSNLPLFFVDRAIVGLGMGIAAVTPIGPIKFSWGRTMGTKAENRYGIKNQNVLYFSAGHDF